MTDEPRIPELHESLRAALERTQAVARQLVGLHLHLHDANELARRSGGHLRLVQRDGTGLTVTADLDARRINTEGDIVVGSSTG